MPKIVTVPSVGRLKENIMSKTAKQEWQQRYDSLKKAGTNYCSAELGLAIIELTHWSLCFLNQKCSKIPLTSKI